MAKIARTKDLQNYGPSWPEIDDRIVKELLLIANGTVEGYGAQTSEQARALVPEFRALLEEATGDTTAEAWQRLYTGRMEILTDGGVEVRLISQMDGGRPRPAFTRSWRDVRAMLSWGVLLTLDVKKQYRAALRRCEHCHRFYLARRNPRGGPANLLYCSPKCRARAHDSTEARAERRRSAARKHK